MHTQIVLPFVLFDIWTLNKIMCQLKPVFSPWLRSSQGILLSLLLKMVFAPFFCCHCLWPCFKGFIFGYFYSHPVPSHQTSTGRWLSIVWITSLWPLHHLLKTIPITLCVRTSSISCHTLSHATGLQERTSVKHRKQRCKCDTSNGVVIAAPCIILLTFYYTRQPQGYLCSIAESIDFCRAYKQHFHLHVHSHSATGNILLLLLQTNVNQIFFNQRKSKLRAKFPVTATLWWHPGGKTCNALSPVLCFGGKRTILDAEVRGGKKGWNEIYCKHRLVGWRTVAARMQRMSGLQC